MKRMESGREGEVKERARSRRALKGVSPAPLPVPSIPRRIPLSLSLSGPASTRACWNPARAMAAPPRCARRLLPRLSIGVLVLLLLALSAHAAHHHPGREFRPGDFLPSARRMQYHGVRRKRGEEGGRTCARRVSQPALTHPLPLHSGPHALGRPPRPALPPLPGRRRGEENKREREGERTHTCALHSLTRSLHSILNSSPSLSPPPPTVPPL